MATQIVMPQLGESVAEGVIGKWLKQEGDPIGKDEPIVEVVTDKVNAEIPSPVAGTLQKISAQEGATVTVGEEIAVIGEPGEADASSVSTGQSVAQVQAEAAGAESGVETGAQGTPGTTEPPAISRDSAGAEATNAAPSYQSGQAGTAVLTGQQEGPDGARRAVRSSPLVQRLAAEHNVDLSLVPGTGIGGRVSKKDILNFIEQGGEAATAGPPTAAEAPTTAPTARPAPTPPPTAIPPRATASQPPPPQPARASGENEEVIPISPVRRMIAEHMVKSKYTLPHATSMIEIDMTPVVQYREAHKAQWQQQEGISLSFMAFVAQATIEALKQYPLVNSEWSDDGIILKKYINLGLAVAAQEGLIVPNIKNADRLSLGGMAHAVNDLTVRARNRRLTPDDVAGGTFTLNNTGAIGSVWSVSIINYPQAGILSADAIVKRVRVMPDDSIAIRHMMNLCMSFDHRTLDGATVSGFLQHIRNRLETWPADAPLY